MAACRRGFERLLRKLLRMKHQPALLVLHWCAHAALVEHRCDRRGCKRPPCGSIKRSEGLLLIAWCLLTRLCSCCTPKVISVLINEEPHIICDYGIGLAA